MKVSEIERLMKNSFSQISKDIELLKREELFQRRAILGMLRIADVGVQQIRDTMIRRIWTTESEQMKRDGGRIDYMELMKRLEKYPIVKEINKQVVKETHDELYKHVQSGEMSPICYYRTIKHMSQEELAEKTNTSQTAVARTERPGYNMTIRTATKYAKALGIEPEKLLLH